MEEMTLYEVIRNQYPDIPEAQADLARDIIEYTERVARGDDMRGYYTALVAAYNNMRNQGYDAVEAAVMVAQGQTTPNDADGGGNNLPPMDRPAPQNIKWLKVGLIALAVWFIFKKL